MTFFYKGYNNKYFGRKFMSFDETESDALKKIVSGTEHLNKVANEKWNLLSSIVLENDTQVFRSMMDHVRTANGKVNSNI